MTTNPFDQHRTQTVAPTNADLRAWCEETNAKPLMQRMERWYYVTSKTDEPERIDCLTGCDAANVRKMLAGQLDDFVGWSEARMNGYRRWLRTVAQAAFVQRDRAA